VDDLKVRDVVPPVARPVNVAGGGDRVQRLPDRTVPDGVDVHLEPAGVDGRDRLLQLLRVEEAGAAAVGLVPVPIEVGGQHRGGEVLTDAVLHDLHAGGAESGAASHGASFGKKIELRQPNRAPPPQGTGDPRGQQAPGVDLAVGVETVGNHRVL